LVSKTVMLLMMAPVFMVLYDGNVVGARNF